MSLNRIEKNVNIAELNGLILNVNNGDLQSLQKIVEDWGFKNEESALRFAIAVMSQSEKYILHIDKDGEKVGLTPSAELKKTSEPR